MYVYVNRNKKEIQHVNSIELLIFRETNSELSHRIHPKFWGKTSSNCKHCVQLTERSKKKTNKKGIIFSA